MLKTYVVFTIGHSTRSTREFIKILKSFDIETLVDIRHYPGSRYCKQFGKARLRKNLLNNNIDYIHLESLGGRRKHQRDSDKNNAWRSLQFRGYADYMQTNEFKEGLKKLISLAKHSVVAIMCSEAVPWRCHRSMVGDALLAQGITVIDIFGDKQARFHFLTPFAKVNEREITYPAI